MLSDFRTFARRLIPVFFYRKLRLLADSWAVLTKEGFRIFIALKSNDGEEVTLQFKSLTHPFSFRQIPSHADGIVQNVLRGEYDAWSPCDEPKYIVDAGAFIGDLTCHWATRYPNAHIVALEPNLDNYKGALKNVLPYAPNVSLLNKGLWSRSGKLYVTGEEMGSHLTEDGLDDANSVEVIDVPSLMKVHGFPYIDILKLDIEGAERNVLDSQSNEWVRFVKMLIVEMHGQGTEDEIVQRLGEQGFVAKRYRSLVYFSRVPAMKLPNGLE